MVDSSNQRNRVDTRKKESCKDSNCKCEHSNNYSFKILLEMLHTTILMGIS